MKKESDTDHIEGTLAEETLRDREKALVEAQDVAKIGSWRFDLATDKVTWSDELYQIFEIDKCDLIYESFLNRVHPEDKELVLQTNARAKREGTQFEVEYRIVVGNGVTKTIREVGYAFRNKEGQVIQLFGMAHDITERKQAEEALHHSREQLRALTSYLQFVREQERTRMARELHDEVGQTLTAIKFSLGSLPHQDGPSGENLKKAQELVNELIRKVHNLSLELRPAMLDDLGLQAAILWHIKRYSIQFKMKVDFELSGLEGRRFHPEIETAAYRIVQEALTNSARHASATRVFVRLLANDQTLNILVEDEGVGFDPATTHSPATAGLSGMRERALGLGGRFSVDSAPGAGAHIQVELPLNTGSSS